MSGWQEVAKQRPCPVCGKPDWCTTSGDAVHCMRSTVAPSGWRLVKACDDGGKVFAPEQTRATNNESWGDKARRYTKALSPENLSRLADVLGVRSDALRAINVGWNQSYDRWTFPERDGAGNIIGVLTRSQNGIKKCMSKSKRGLTIPNDFSARDGVIFVVEGPSDVAACLVMGLAVVGRPSNSGGAKHLSSFLKGRDILIVGENDEKDTGEWPGKDGAKGVAQLLATKWKHPVKWAMPPEGTKDIRQFLNDKAISLDDVNALEAAGRELLAILQENATDAQPQETDEDDEGKKSRVTRLIEFASAAELFHDRECEAYATIVIESHQETMLLKGKAFKRWLSRQYYDSTGGAANGQHLADAMNVIQAQAVFDGPELPVHVRIADHAGSIWIDVGDSEWHAIEVTKTVWRVVANSPVKFIRPRGMLPLPMPVAGGSIDALRPFLNVASDDDWKLLISGMVAAFRSTGPYVIIVFNGEAGSAKSTACRIVRAIIDPNVSAIRAEPREGRDIMIAARNSWLLAFDNLSKIQPWLSDSLCRLATGGGFSTRELFSDADEIIFDSQRPILLNGIDDLCTRGDLADRSVILTLNPIDDADRKTEVDLWAEFEGVRPRIFGALLDAVSRALRDVASVKLRSHPRMADFASWACAAAPALGWTAEEFLRAYSDNRAASVALSIESSPIGPAIVGLMNRDGRTCWDGTARELLTELSADRCSDERTRRRKDWPTSPRGLSGALRRLCPELRKTGIDVTWLRAPGGSRKRVIHVENIGEEPSRPSQQTTAVDSEPETAICRDGSGTVGTQTPEHPPSRAGRGTVGDANENGQPSRENGDSGCVESVRDERDGRDDVAGSPREHGEESTSGGFVGPIDGKPGEEVDSWTF